MGLSRRFLNLIVAENIRTRSLCCIDLRRNDFFYPDPDTSPPPTSLAAAETIQLPDPTMSFRAGSFRCFPIAGRKVLCTEGRKVFCTEGRRQHALLFDADTRHVVTMPNLRTFKWRPVSFFVPSAGDADAADPDGTLFFMEKWPKQEARSLGPESHQFEAFVYRRSSKTSPSKSWRRRLIPPPPFLRDPRYWNRSTKIISSAIVGGGTHICISVDDAGTYCMDTESHEWSKVGEWMLPFRGKAEYVPELKLWFGLSNSDEDRCLVAADLSAMTDSGPELLGEWKDLDDIPGKCRQLWDSQIVYLGSGRFCIARFLIMIKLDQDPDIEHFALFTGVEVIVPKVHEGGCSGDRHGGGNVGLRVIKHKSRCTPKDTYIENVF